MGALALMVYERLFPVIVFAARSTACIHGVSGGSVKDAVTMGNRQDPW